MRAKDDAASTRSPRSRSSVLALLLIGALFGAILAIGLAPPSLERYEVRMPWAGAALSEADWPRGPGSGESAEIVTGPRGLELVVRAPGAVAAEALARDLAAHQSGATPALRELDEELRARWRASVPHGPSLPMTRGSEIGALLLAEASLRHELARQLPGPYAGPAAEQPPAPSVAVLERQRELALALPLAEPAAIEQSLLEAAATEAEWVGSSAVAGASAAARGAQWRRWQVARADSLQAAAERMLDGETALQRSLADWVMPARRARLGDSRASAYLALASAQVPPAVPGATPIAAVWAMLAGIGALTGGAAAAVGAALARRGAVPRAGSEAPPRRDPAATDAWLHVVCGPDRSAIARAVLELASHPLSRGERVLVVDASPRLAMHERLGREARWGLMECLHCDMPVLGLVQYGGAPGLYLLAHGEAARAAAGWSGLGRRLDEARPHFARVLLCIDRAAPRELGDALRGRPLEGWWAEPGERLPRAGAELPGRLGIAFSGMEMSHFPEMSLERLAARVAQLAPLRPEPAVVSAAPLPPEPRPLPAAVPAAPVVLDCDLQVQQRLRFLAWMRRVQSESRREELEPVA